MKDIKIPTSYKKCFVFLVLCVSSSWVLAQEPETVYRVSDLVRKALEQSEILEATKNRIEKNRMLKHHASRWQNPSLGFDVGRKFEGSEAGLLYDLSLTQSFYFPGKQRLRYEVAQMDEELALLEFEKRKLQVQYEVIRHSYEYVAAQELIQHTQERIKRFKLMKKYMKGRPFVSPQAKAEKLIVENKLRLFERDLARLKKERDKAWAQLNLYLGFPERTAVNVEWLHHPLTVALDDVMQETLENNLDLKTLMGQREKLVRKKLLAEKETLPDFSLSGFYGEESVESDEKRFGIGFSIDLPLLNRNIPLLKSLSSEIEAQESLIQFEVKRLKQKLLSLYAQYEAATAETKLFPLSLVAKVDKELVRIDQEFRKNRIDLLSYLEVEAEAYEVHVAVYESQINLIKVYTRILTLAGRQNFGMGGLYAY